MKSISFLKAICIVLIILSLAGCNYPGALPQATPTSLPPTPTSPPPTEPPTPIPPTEAPTLPPPTEPPAPPTPIPPTPTSRPSPTPTAVKPAAGVKFDGTFDGGTLTFRTNPTGYMVVPKTIRVVKANCQNGKTLSDTLSFEPPTYYPVEDGKFTINWDSQVIMSGVFQTSTQARGTLELKFKKEGVACTIGPVPWSASAVE
jgi:hypothetical protein